MSRLRKLFFWLHLVAGVGGGAVILVMAATGVVLTYERQLLDWANSGLRAAPSADAQRLPLGTLLAAAAEKQGAAPSGATWRADPAAPVAVNFGREGMLYVNPYTGAVLGEGAKGWREFFHITTDLHRWLALEGDRRPLGKSLTGAANLAFLFLALSGLYLWWPRQWRWKPVKAVLLFDPRLRGKMRDFNWHNVLGFWACLPLVVIIATGVVMSYPWANDLLFRLAGSEAPPPRTAGGPPPGARREGPRPAASFDAINPLAAQAERHLAGWQSITLRLPATFVLEQNHRGRPDRKVTLNFDAKTGALTGEETFASYNRGRQWRLWARWLHTGEAGGLPGQTLAGLASAAAAVLVFTGLALSVRRFLAWRKKGARGPALPAPAESPAPESANLG